MSISLPVEYGTSSKRGASAENADTICQFDSYKVTFQSELSVFYYVRNGLSSCGRWLQKGGWPHLQIPLTKHPRHLTVGQRIHAPRKVPALYAVSAKSSICSCAKFSHRAETLTLTLWDCKVDGC